MAPDSGGVFPSAEAQREADVRHSGETHLPGIGEKNWQGVCLRHLNKPQLSVSLISFLLTNFKPSMFSLYFSPRSECNGFGATFVLVLLDRMVFIKFRIRTPSGGAQRFHWACHGTIHETPRPTGFLRHRRGLPLPYV